ncbi:hypothetical protein BDY21DRAFT_286768 [Lineolata rhizophorae]|uniref:Aminoglycoside phosphotransferase domain-containing protein n=1 Tax=Lineolata rhizophorae TaxID=578093 RepID=A0A6A6NYB3_9PEZI|nr:hypothetical protein BDY21DRAFT_286768 [Lineolata rhizophorae]
METPSNEWLSLESFRTGSDTRTALEETLSELNFGCLCSRAIIARSKVDGTRHANITCNINKGRFKIGRHYLIMEVAFMDNVSWIARIQRAREDPSRSQMEKTAFECEVATMKVVREHTEIPVPAVFDFDALRLSKVGRRYMLMEHLPGRPLHKIERSETSAGFQDKVARQLADVLFELQFLAFDRIGRLWCGRSGRRPVQVIQMPLNRELVHPFNTSLEYFHAIRGAANKHAMQEAPTDRNKRTACWILSTATPRFVLSDRIHGPFPLAHLDLNSENCLFDDQFNLTGVIDWRSAQAVPMEHLAACSDIESFCLNTQTSHRSTREFKRLVVDYLAVKERSRFLVLGGESSPQSLASAQMPSKDNMGRTPLSEFMDSKEAEIAGQCMSSTSSLIVLEALTVHALVYDDHVSWDQLKAVNGNTKPPT